MARGISSAHPLQTLREQVVALDAAVLLCLAKPAKEAVHRLRTTTRRIEAQLALLSMLPGLPPHEKQARKVRRLLKKLRRAAGSVRDIDVHRDLIREEVASCNGSGKAVRNEARHLRDDLKRQREEEAIELERMLHKEHARIPLVFEELLDALEPAEDLALSESQLMDLVRKWYAQGGGKGAVSDRADDLHGIRKRAKLARYLAESAPDSGRARRLAAKFEKLQQAGGHWHDWLMLADVAKDELGNSAELPQRFAAQADRALRVYQHRLNYRR